MDYINGKLTSIMSANELQEEIETLQTAKQDVLVSGNNIKTINGQTLLGSGNLSIPNVSVIDNNTYITLTVDGVSYNLTKYQG